MAKKWVFREEVDDIKVYEDSTGDIKCVYPKAPKWAADVAERIWNNAEHEGMPTEKGIKDIVHGQWGFWIANARPEENLPLCKKHNVRYVGEDCSICMANRFGEEMIDNLRKNIAASKERQRKRN